MRELPYYNSFFKSANPPAIELAQLLDELTPPQFHRVFFTQSGSEAQRHDPAHGAPLLGPDGPAEAQGHHQPHQRLSRQHDGRRRASAAWPPCTPRAACRSPTSCTSSSRTGTRTASTSRRRNTACAPRGGSRRRSRSSAPERVAAFIGEPIQGAGGVIIPPSTYWPEIQRICREYGILLIADEVICGFGRTGPVVRLRLLRHRAGLHDDRQGPHLGLPAARRRDGRRTAWPTC